MLRLSKSLFLASAAAALLTSSPASAQGLDTRITDAGTKLDQDIQGCKPIDLGEYSNLLREAAENKLRANKAAKKGVPVDQAKVDADLANASALFNRAMSALVGQCVHHAQQQAQPPSTSMKDKVSSGFQQYLDARSKCDFAAMDVAIAGSRDKIATYWWLEYKSDAKLFDYPADMRRCAEQGLGTGTSQYATQFDLPPADSPRKAESIDPDSATIKLPGPAEVGAKPKPYEDTPFGWASVNRRPDGGGLSTVERAILEIHNNARAAVGAQPLKWNPAMAGRATVRAGENARVGQLNHAPREGRGTERENIARAPLGYSAVQIVNRWLAELADFVPGKFPNVCRSGGDCEGVLHVTQMLWPETTEIGCGMAVGGAAAWMVCRYNPGGNKPGRMVGIPQTTGLADAGSRIEQPALPPTEVFNSSVRPRLIGGDYSGGKAAVAQGQTPKIASEHSENKMSGQFYAPLFDLGIYAGGAYTTDWFEIGEPDDDQMTWGVDLDVVEKYIWRGIALGRDVDLQPSNWVSAYGFSAPVWAQIANELVSDPLDPDDPLGSGIYWDPVSQVTIGLGANFVDAAELGDQATTVDQPTLPPAEVFNANAPKVAASDKQEPSNPLPRCGGFSFFDAVKLYQAAKDKGDSAGMIAAKGLMAHGIASQRRSVEDAVATYEVAPKGLSPAGFMAVLDGMMSQYEELTGEQAPGTYDPPEGYELADDVRKPTDTAVEQPVMPPTEVFKAAEQQHYCADVM